MKFGKLYLCFILAAAMICSGCAKEDIPVFETDDSGIYFLRVAGFILNSNAETYADSVTYSFSTTESIVTSRTLWVMVYSMGKLRDYDRPVKLSIDRDKTTAIEGYHYEFDPDNTVIRAGLNRDTVKVRFFRTEDLLDGSVTLALKLEENEHFKCYLEEYKNTNVFSSTGAQISGTQFKFIVSETYKEPFYWEFFGDTYFGKWTPMKFATLNAFTGWTVADWEDAGFPGATIQLGRFNFVATRFRKHLQELADAGTPARESDGSLMQLGAAYLVDYSAYD